MSVIFRCNTIRHTTAPVASVGRTVSVMIFVRASLVSAFCSLASYVRIFNRYKEESLVLDLGTVLLLSHLDSQKSQKNTPKRDTLIFGRKNKKPRRNIFHSLPKRPNVSLILFRILVSTHHSRNRLFYIFYKILWLQNLCHISPR